MAAVLQGRMQSHVEQTMASDDYPDWLTAEHRTGVSKRLSFLSSSFFCMSRI